jgi:carbon-monoxide dehydrogenase medium subunit
VIPAPFDYFRAECVDHTLDLLAEYGDEAKVLAGGHSLLPLMKLRLASPAVLVDIGELRELSYVRDADDHVAVGPLTRHADVERSESLRLHAPLLAHVAGQIGDPQVRHRGTIGGSVAHGDPASDLPAALLALRATVVVRSLDGPRVVSIDDFFTGFLETALAPDEIIAEIRVPKADSSAWSFQKFTRRAQDWAIVTVACVRNGRAGIGLVNMGATPLRAAAAEAALDAGTGVEAAADLAAEGTTPGTDLHASAQYRRHLARALVRRALCEASDPVT